MKINTRTFPKKLFLAFAVGRNPKLYHKGSSYIDRNPRGFGMFWTKSVEVLGSLKPRGFGISAL